MEFLDRFASETPLLGMVHLGALPGAPRYDGDRKQLRARALGDALALTESGFDGLVVENFGDAPFYPEDVPEHVVAEMTATIRELGIAVDVPFGVNVLRNDARAALSVAAATGGSFVRVNVHTGSRETDQGRLTGRAHETLRLRERLDADVDILADVDVKHSAPAADRDLQAVVEETIDRGLADGVIVSGPATGKQADADRLETVLDARDDATRDVPVLVGSGVTAANAPALLDVADGAVVGTAVKEDGETTNPVDADRAADLVEAVRGSL